MQEEIKMLNNSLREIARVVVDDADRTEEEHPLSALLATFTERKR